MVNSYTSQGIDYKYHELKYKGSLFLQMFTSTIAEKYLNENHVSGQ